MSDPANKDDSGLSPADYETFCTYLRERTGLSFTEAKRYYVDRRVAERMAAVGADSFRDYLNLLRFQASGEELQLLVNLMTVNETYFFREKYQLDCLVNSALDEVVRARRPGSRVRIWSAGCATGEEPYSIAIMLLEYWKRVDEFEIELYASDIDSRVLARAREGIYEERALHAVPQELVAKYFTQLDSRRWQIMEELRESIDFSLVNIADPKQVAGFQSFDVIFCRNLLIYFDDLGRRQAAAMFYEALSPCGFIALGHSESMSRMSSLFVPRRFPDAILYQKPQT
ncbi:CheR family methyltransferase [Azospirillum rugosum]|uniref:Chemotaxis protein methyltransferase n=1 Tax=Azospirillum rugosum TaxID=416170 RepID=A0ABS4SHA8_9PROT|nr:CheR family methyltransferase [Azospirillum rugosum]MBP2291337.1 chemotaxis protein methyltransferase CheR [Azospirillum rugosum]MDQ0525125.1 chemotaxis protein methyltransferase CheR [Azospirillum rugosum]